MLSPKLNKSHNKANQRGRQNTPPVIKRRYIYKNNNLSIFTLSKDRSRLHPSPNNEIVAIRRSLQSNRSTTFNILLFSRTIILVVFAFIVSTSNSTITSSQLKSYDKPINTFRLPCEFIAVIIRLLSIASINLAALLYPIFMLRCKNDAETQLPSRTMLTACAYCTSNSLVVFAIVIFSVAPSNVQQF